MTGGAPAIIALGGLIGPLLPRIPIPLEMEYRAYLVVLAVSLVARLCGALLSLKTVWSIDPVAVFR